MKEPVILKNAFLIDGNGGEPVADGTVVVVEKKIAEILPPGSKAQVSGDRVFDLKGKTLMPGQIDAHVHVGNIEVLHDRTAALAPAVYVHRATGNLETDLDLGFTTLRDAGGPVLEKMGMAGIPALMGIDISGSLKTRFPLLGSGTPQDTIYGVYGGLARKGLNATSAVEREDYLRAIEFASPAFIEAVLKAYRMSETGATMPRGKLITDEKGKPIHLEPGEGVAQAAGFRPERLARISGEHWTMENVQKHFKEKKDDLYSRYRLAKSSEEKQGVIRDMQKFNLEARKHRGVIPPITATSLRQAALQKPEKFFLSFGKVMGVSP